MMPEIGWGKYLEAWKDTGAGHANIEWFIR